MQLRTFLLALTLLSSACDVKPASQSDDRQQVLRDLVAHVIVPTYGDLASLTSALSSAAVQLQQTPNSETLTEARRLYRAARAQQKMSEAYQFGPSEDLAITGGTIDSWPADRVQLEALLASETPIDATLVTRLPGNQRGFPGLEHWLYDSSKSDAELLARFSDVRLGARLTALVSATAGDLAGKCRTLSDAWSAPGGYGAQLAEAGLVSGGAYASQSAGVDDVVTGLVYVSELMVMKKLAAPLGVDQGGAVQPALEEAPRSDLSLEDLRSNVNGIEAIYTGARGEQSGLGLAQSVRAMNPGAAQRFEQALAATHNAIDAVPPPLRVALTDNRASVEAVYQAVRGVKMAIVVELAGALGASIGFGYSDTD